MEGLNGGPARGPLVLRGIVVDEQGAPVPDAVVALVAGPAPLPDIAALTGDDGRFATGVPAAGEYEVQARQDERVATVAVAVGPDSQDDEVRLVLR